MREHHALHYADRLHQRNLGRDHSDQRLQGVRFENPGDPPASKTAPSTSPCVKVGVPSEEVVHAEVIAGAERELPESLAGFTPVNTQV